MEFLKILPFIVFIGFIVISAGISATANQKRQRRTFSSDGHMVPKNQDLTCNRYGHNHEVSNEFGRRYVVHEDPEEGYVVLNGIKRKLEDCKYL